MRKLSILQVLLLVAAQSCWVDRSEAQQTRKPQRIAVVLVAITAEGPEMQAFREGLRDAGIVEGRDIVLEWRSAQGEYSRVPSVVAESLLSRPAVLVVETAVAAGAARKVDPDVPIVMALSGDPVGSGLVESLARPGGNVTGVSMMMDAIAIKRCQLLREALPTTLRLGVLWDPNVPFHAKALEDLSNWTRAIGVALTAVPASQPKELPEAFAKLRTERVQALCVLDDAFFAAQRSTILQLASRTRIPIAFGDRRWVEEGALLSYTADFSEMFRRAAAYVDKVLKGTKPGAIPIEQPTKFELVVSLQAARELGLQVSQAVLIQADAVVR